MKWIQIIVAFLLIGGLLSCVEPKPSNTEQAHISQSLDSLITDLINSEELIGAELTITEDGVQTFQKVYGWRSLDRNSEIQKNDIWAVKSMTKPVTATAILMLQDDGLLSLDDPVINYLPQYQGFKEATIRNLLLQNSGDDGSHGNQSENIFDFNSQEEWVLDWANQRPKGVFGEYNYSNFNYEALGYIISQVSGQSVEQFIEDRIIQPMGLKNTFTNFSPSSAWAGRVPNRYRVGDQKKIDLIQTNKVGQSWAFFPASFGLWMSNEDFMTFFQMWMNDGRHNELQLLKSEAVKKALQIGVWINEDDGAGQGLGWQIENGPFIYYKGGADGSIGIAYPDRKMIIVFTTHMQGGNHLGKIWNVLGKDLLGWD